MCFDRDEHLRDVVLKSLMHGARGRDIQNIIDKKGDFRVASWHFKASDKFKGRGSGQSVLPQAVPLSRRESEEEEQGQAPPRSSPRSCGAPPPSTAPRADHGANAQSSSGRRGSGRRDITDFEASGLSHRELVRKVHDLAKLISDQRGLLDQARITREREQRVSDETRRKLREAQEELDRLAERARELEEVQKNLETRNAQLEAIAAGSRRILDWDTLMDPDSPWSSKISQLTGMRNAAILKAVFEWVDCGGVSSRLKTWHHAQSVDRMKAVERNETQRTSSGHTDKLRSPQNCFLVTQCLYLQLGYIWPCIHRMSYIVLLVLHCHHRHACPYEIL